LYSMLNAVIRRQHRLRVVYTTGHWLDVDSLSDILVASDFT